MYVDKHKHSDDETLAWVSAQEAPFTAPDMARALQVQRDVALKRLVRRARRGLVKRVGTVRRAHVRRPVVLWMRALPAAPSEGDPDG
jgi:predicted ArsR family transcriptional regulator